MTSNTRRPGFRLWGGDSADEPEEQQTGQQPDAAEPAEESAAPAPAAEAPTPATPPEPVSEPAPEPSDESAGFLASLVNAMRSVAEEARDTSLAEFRDAVERRITELQVEASERAEELRRQADGDVAAIGEWQSAEIERIKAEAEQKTEARRTQLDHQLSDHGAASEAQVSAIRDRLAVHEKELTAFFAQLSEIHDPGAFVAAAKRMPRPPQIVNGGATSHASTQPPRQTLDMRLAALGVDRSQAETPAPPTAAAPAHEPEPEPESARESAAPEPESAETGDVATADEATAAEAELETPATETAPPEPTATDTQRDAQLAGRLAELDSELAGTAAPAQDGTADATPSGGETSTAIIVKGLGSFGAITSFKQALERVDGILGVTLSLGPTGEFVYRASHAANFDLAAAVRSVEGPGVQIERADGSLRVAVSRNR